MLSRFIRAWNPFLFTPIDARPLALFRILTGLLCCCFMACLCPNWHRFFAADGIISLNSPDLVNTRVNNEHGLFYWTEGIVPIDVWWYVGMALSVMFLIGWKTRLATLALYVFVESLLRRNPYIANGEELVLRMCLFYMIFSRPGAVWSIDAMNAARRGLSPVKFIPSWAIRMLQMNIAMIYIISLPWKLATDPCWVTGDAIHWTVASDMWGPSQHPWITLSCGGLLRKIMTFGTVLVEAFFPLAVWFKPTRRTAILLITSLHLGIAIMIPNVTFFTLSMVCNFAAFLTGEDIDAMVRLTRLTRSLPHHEASSQRTAVPAR